MTRESEELLLVRKVVVVIDICSSTSILEDLKRTDNLTPWRNLLIELKDSMLEQAVSKRPGLEVYKFIGGGWIVLLPTDVSQDGIAELLTDLSIAYDVAFDSRIRGLLQRKPATVGITFGIDSGELVGWK